MRFQPIHLSGWQCNEIAQQELGYNIFYIFNLVTHDVCIHLNVMHVQKIIPNQVIGCYL